MNANSVSAKNKVVNRAVAAVNRVDSKADDKPVILKRKRREATPAAFYVVIRQNELRALSCRLLQQLRREMQLVGSASDELQT